MSLVVHGDDCTALGVDESIDKLEAGLKALFELKVRGRIGEHLPLKEMRMLNRIVTLTDKGLLYGADPRHAELLVRNLAVSNSVAAPGVEDSDLKDQAPKDHEDVGGMESKHVEPADGTACQSCSGPKAGSGNIRSRHAHK